MCVCVRVCVCVTVREIFGVVREHQAIHPQHILELVIRALVENQAETAGAGKCAHTSTARASDCTNGLIYGLVHLRQRAQICKPFGVV